MLPNDTPLTGPDLLQRFLALDTFLLEHQALWRPKPFTVLELPWEHDHPELATWLRSRSLEEADAVHNVPQQLDAPAPFPTLAAMAAKLSVVGEFPATPMGKLSNLLTVDVPGRKWQQIEACSPAAWSSPRPAVSTGSTGAPAKATWAACWPMRRQATVEPGIGQCTG